MDVNRPTWDRLRLELRIIGIAAPVTALAATLGGAILVIVMRATGAAAEHLDLAAGAVLAGFAPLGTAVAASSIVGRDPGAELVMTSTVYRRVLFLRVGLVVVPAALVTLVDAVVFRALDAWPEGQGTGGYVLVWAPPMLWLVALAMLIAIGLRSPGAATGLIGGIWLAQDLMKRAVLDHPVLRAQYLFLGVDAKVPAHEWTVNRIALPAVGVAAVIAAGLLLGRPERFVGSETA
ncbi:hypothetical protein [Streptomyces rubellomurinus]|uniref:Uncharacterized protein n=1 Tax=Streptomyces rubellomurinus (strain ATCC 31215) TaxID=359131 RepID=A0A0F2TM02_STRR3|nr:hypothetical protein [Streptomyces rubellomurinus]KJS63320.1 hypothetical protein VM95_03745 [Streptomyces rubellomurinus]